MINKNTIIIRNKEIATNELDGKIVMMHIQTGKYYNFDSVGTDIWYLLENPITFDELIGKLTDMYEIDRETCENDTLPFIQGLARNKLVELSE